MIIGAHAVVSGHIEGDSVWGGVPAMPFEEWRAMIAC